jgi:hypothetical protein
VEVGKGSWRLNIKQAVKSSVGRTKHGVANLESVKEDDFWIDLLVSPKLCVIIAEEGQTTKDDLKNFPLFNH